MCRLPREPSVPTSSSSGVNVDSTVVLAPATCRMRVFNTISDVLGALQIDGIATTSQLFGDLYDRIGRRFKDVSFEGVCCV